MALLGAAPASSGGDGAATDAYRDAPVIGDFPTEVAVDFGDATRGGDDERVDCEFAGPTLWVRVAPGDPGSVLAELATPGSSRTTVAVVRETEDGTFDTRTCNQYGPDADTASSHTLRYADTGYALVVASDDPELVTSLSVEARDPVEVTWTYGSGSYVSATTGAAYVEIEASCKNLPTLEFEGTATQQIADHPDGSDLTSYKEHP